uniref:Ig-like domain-containing protein n=1 Tax=Daphnia galeata TaxID=27404 RepID=A0A8J2WCA7_9CRUS|nr:unnamed protein product [Daphnia galeata]
MMLNSRQNPLHTSGRSSKRMTATIIRLNVQQLWMFFLMTVSGDALSSRHSRSFTKYVMLSDGSITPSTVTTAEPHFSESIRNVTVPLGREAVLSCVINNLADYKKRQPAAKIL